MFVLQLGCQIGLVPGDAQLWGAPLQGEIVYQSQDELAIHAAVDGSDKDRSNGHPAQLGPEVKQAAEPLRASLHLVSVERRDPDDFIGRGEQLWSQTVK
ncbi:hypothetical protein D3C76_1344890 [compost metagenome]